MEITWAELIEETHTPGGMKSLSMCGPRTAWGSTRRFFSGRRISHVPPHAISSPFTLELGGGQCPTCKCKQTRLFSNRPGMLCDPSRDRRHWTPISFNYFLSMSMPPGGGQKSGIFNRGPQGSHARISAKFRKLFFVWPYPHIGNHDDKGAAKIAAKLGVGGGRSGADMTRK
jgi:hypothetical protein